MALEKMKEFLDTKLDHTPLGIVIKLALVVMTTEFIIMLAIEFLLKPMLGRNTPDEYWNYADPVLLGFFLVPVLYLLVMRPLKEQQLQLKIQNDELQAAAAKLLVDEAQVIAAHQKELETRERMIQVEKLSSMGTMVGGVAHEINNPLMGILNYVEYARDKATDSKSKEVLEDALHEINRIKNIVRNMLVFIRADSSHQERCCVQETVKQTLALLEGELRRNSVQVHLQLPEAAQSVKCSAGSLQQMLLNLMLNARDAIAEQEDQHITIIGQHEDGKVVLLICDNGPGIPPGMLEKIFDPFFTTKPVGKGTGLGLSVSRHLIEEVGGSINPHLVQGYGCCFRLVFKAA